MALKTPRPRTKVGKSVVWLVICLFVWVSHFSLLHGDFILLAAPVFLSSFFLSFVIWHERGRWFEWFCVKLNTASEFCERLRSTGNLNPWRRGADVLYTDTSNDGHTHTRVHTQFRASGFESRRFQRRTHCLTFPCPSTGFASLEWMKGYRSKCTRMRKKEKNRRHSGKGRGHRPSLSTIYSF